MNKVGSDSPNNLSRSISGSCQDVVGFRSAVDTIAIIIMLAYFSKFAEKHAVCMIILYERIIEIKIILSVGRNRVILQKKVIV